MAPDSAAARPAARWVSIATKLAITVAAFYLALRTVDVHLLLERLARINPSLFAVAVVALSAQVALVAVRWRLIVQRLDPSRTLSLSLAAAIAYSAQFVNQFLPFAAGDALRAVLVARGGVSTRTSVNSVLIDRAVGLVVLFVLALPPLFVPQLRSSLPYLSQALLILILVFLTAVAALVAASGALIRFFSQRRYTRLLAGMLEDGRSVALHLPTAGATALLSLIVQLLTVIAVWALAGAVAAQISLVTLWLLIPPMLLATMFPFTVSGWGARESVVVVFLAAMGIPGDRALSLSVAYGAAVLIAALPGAATWLALSRRRP